MDEPPLLTLNLDSLPEINGDDEPFIWQEYCEFMFGFRQIFREKLYTVFLDDLLPNNPERKDVIVLMDTEPKPKPTYAKISFRTTLGEAFAWFRRSDVYLVTIFVPSINTIFRTDEIPPGISQRGRHIVTIPHAYSGLQSDSGTSLSTFECTSSAFINNVRFICNPIPSQYRKNNTNNLRSHGVDTIIKSALYIVVGVAEAARIDKIFKVISKTRDGIMRLPWLDDAVRNWGSMGDYFHLEMANHKQDYRRFASININSFHDLARAVALIKGKNSEYELAKPYLMVKRVSIDSKDKDVNGVSGFLTMKDSKGRTIIYSSQNSSGVYKDGGSSSRGGRQRLILRLSCEESTVVALDVVSVRGELHLRDENGKIFTCIQIKGEWSPYSDDDEGLWSFNDGNDNCVNVIYKIVRSAYVAHVTCGWYYSSQYGDGSLWINGTITTSDDIILFQEKNIVELCIWTPLPLETSIIPVNVSSLLYIATDLHVTMGIGLLGSHLHIKETHKISPFEDYNVPYDGESVFSLKMSVKWGYE